MKEGSYYSFCVRGEQGTGEAVYFSIGEALKESKTIRINTNAKLGEAFFLFWAEFESLFFVARPREDSSGFLNPSWFVVRKDSYGRGACVFECFT